MVPEPCKLVSRGRQTALQKVGLLLHCFPCDCAPGGAEPCQHPPEAHGQPSRAGPSQDQHLTPHGRGAQLERAHPGQWGQRGSQGSHGDHPRIYGCGGRWARAMLRPPCCRASVGQGERGGGSGGGGGAVPALGHQEAGVLQVGAPGCVQGCCGAWAGCNGWLFPLSGFSLGSRPNSIPRARWCSSLRSFLQPCPCTGKQGAPSREKERRC